MWYIHTLAITAVYVFFFFKQKKAYEMRISDWSSDVCSSDLDRRRQGHGKAGQIRVDLELILHRQHRIARARQLLGVAGTAELRAAGERAEIGRASCRERVCQYV